MAEFISKERPAKYKSTPDSGFNAMGKPVPLHRRTAALEHCKQMSLGIEEAWAVVGGMSEQLERDQPYEAQAIGMKYLDLCGTYRVMAVLLTAELA